MLTVKLPLRRLLDALKCAFAQCLQTTVNNVQTRCMAKGEAQKSPLFWVDFLREGGHFTVHKFSFFTYNWSLFTHTFSVFCLQLELFCLQWKVHLISALRDCKQRCLTVSKKAPTVMRIRFSTPPPTPEFLCKDFRLQPRLKWKFLLRRTWSGQKLPTAISRTFTPLIRRIRFP